MEQTCLAQVPLTPQLALSDPSTVTRCSVLRQGGDSTCSGTRYGGGRNELEQVLQVDRAHNAAGPAPQPGSGFPDPAHPHASTRASVGPQIPGEARSDLLPASIWSPQRGDSVGSWKRREGAPDTLPCPSADALTPQAGTHMQPPPHRWAPAQDPLSCHSANAFLHCLHAPYGVHRLDLLC